MRGALLVSVVLAVSVPPLSTANPGPRAGITTACSNEAVTLPPGRVTLRFVLHGNVSCAEAHSTMRAYARAVVAGHCPTRICDMVFPGGWTCGSTSAVEEQANGGILGGCSRKGADFAVYKARSRQPSSGGVQAMWHDAAGKARFPVYRPRQTLGVPFNGVQLSGCLVATWGDSHSSKGPHFDLHEPGDSVRCGQPGEAVQVATTVINGASVQVLVQCPTVPRCTVQDGQSRGEFLLFVPEPGPNHYTIQLDSTHLPLDSFLKIAKSFTRVR